MSCDRISQMPDSLLTEILSYLSTKKSVSTSVLSKRWKSLWRIVPVLNLKFGDASRGEASEIFVDKFMEFHKGSGTKIQMFKIEFDGEENIPDQLEDWIGTTVGRGVPHLDIVCYENYYLLNRYMPLKFFMSDSLVYLKLVSVRIKTPDKFRVSLPCLKFMFLNDIWCDDSMIMEKLISGSPVLEDLRFIKHFGQDVLVVLRVRSLSLKRFSFWFEDNRYSTEFSVEIDAPQLEYLSFNDNQSDMIVVKNLNSLSVVDIDSVFNVRHGTTLDTEDSRKTNTIRAFLSGISSVRDMLIYESTLNVMYQYSELGQIPNFNNLYRLEAKFSISVLQLLPFFLESCPNLRKLVLDFSVSEGIEQVELSKVPVCLSLTLEFVEIKKLDMEKETWIQVVNYFLENSAVLKKLYVSFKASQVTHQELDAYKNLLSSTKLSRRCEVVFIQ